MHMSDALISPSVGAAMWAVSTAAAGYCVKKVAVREREGNHSLLPVMGIMGAFVFAAQMINFSIWGTGSSGHLGGGILLAALLGPQAGFLAMAAVLAIQALFFGDGGLLAYGCNLFNLGLIPCLLVFPLVYRTIDGPGTPHGKARIIMASMLAAIAALQLGAFSVVVQTWCSGITELPFREFTLLMQPIHLAIGIVEGIATAAVILFIKKIEPSWLEVGLSAQTAARPAATKQAFTSLIAVTVLTGGILSWFASSQPDGLEWSAAKTSGQEELTAPETGIYQTSAEVQEAFSLLPGYNFKTTPTEQEEPAGNWPQISTGTSVSGLLGSGIHILLALMTGLVLKKKSQRTTSVRE